MEMNIAVVGNRKGWSYWEIEKTLKKYYVYKSDVIITGGAEGVDTFAQEFAKKHGNRIMIIYPDLTRPSPQRYYERNKKIALECEFMFIFNRDNNPRSGSFNVMNQAKKLKKELMIIKGDENWLKK
jgi:predicted Rossmann fold nucleotide-binding protein DprA/Smf involved in DNA uptake